MKNTYDSSLGEMGIPAKTAGKKARLVILIRDGILETVIADQEQDTEVLKVDVDDQSEEEVIYRLETIEVDSRAIEDHFRKAQEFWKREEAADSQNQ
ncbi:MAG: hypothetical protein ABSF90_31755 [Syntrophobacteraceae bacterium]|jgi:hypothetical protein